jgi:hypothetical protein
LLMTLDFEVVYEIKTKTSKFKRFKTKPNNNIIIIIIIVICGEGVPLCPPHKINNINKLLLTI